MLGAASALLKAQTIHRTTSSTVVHPMPTPMAVLWESIMIRDLVEAFIELIANYYIIDREMAAEKRLSGLTELIHVDTKEFNQTFPPKYEPAF